MDGQELRTEPERHHAKGFGWALSCCGHDPAEALARVPARKQQALRLVFYHDLSLAESIHLSQIHETEETMNHAFNLFKPVNFSPRKNWGSVLPVCALSLQLMATGASSAAESNPWDALGEALFPPELILQHQSDIGLTEEQRQGIMSTMRQAEERFPQIQERLQKEVEALGALLKNQRVDETAALAQLDRVQTQEREIKRAHLKLVIGLKNQLTGDQQAELQELRKQMTAHLPAVRAKMERVQAGVQRWQSSGRDPSRISDITRELEPLMREGKTQEAEAVLDRALKVLGEGEKH